MGKGYTGTVHKEKAYSGVRLIIRRIPRIAPETVPNMYRNSRFQIRGESQIHKTMPVKENSLCRCIHCADPKSEHCAKSGKLCLSRFPRICSDAMPNMLEKPQLGGVPSQYVSDVFF